MKLKLFVVATCLLLGVTAGAARGESMDRAKRAEINAQKWGVVETVPDPDLASAKNRLIYGEILDKGTLSDKRKVLAIMAALVASQGFDELKTWLEGALKVGLTPLEIREAVLQCAPYAGYPRAQAAMKIVYGVFAEKNIKTPIETAATVNEQTRLEAGVNAQRKIFGAEHIDPMREKAPAGQKEIIANYLSAWCFGDFYTRGGLNLQERELVTFCAIAALGGCDPQVKAHAAANISVGATKQNLVDALATILPFIGFPRTLNALAMVNQAAPEKADR